MDLDDVALRIIKEDLVPAAHGPGAVVRIGNTLLAETLPKRGDIIGPESNVSALQRIDRLLRAKADEEVLLRQVELGGAVLKKGDIAPIALFSDARVTE